MRYILDACVALKWVIEEADSDESRRLRDSARAGVHNLFVPTIFPSEIMNSPTKAERQKRIQQGDGWSHYLTIISDARVHIDYYPLVARAYEISSSYRIGFYDCVYVALAEQEGCELVTADQRLIRNLQPTLPFIIELADLP